MIDLHTPWIETMLGRVGARAVHNDTRLLQPGDVMVWDSRIAPARTASVLADATARGAAFVVSDVAAPNVAQVPDAGVFLAAWAARRWPGQPPKLVGVTGTSGKTSVVWFARQLAALAGYKSASIGTLGVMRSDTDIEEEYTGFTSPTALKLHPILHQLAAEQIELAAMEISSHALELRRVEAAKLAAAGFTNLSQDHLDFHGTLEAYFRAKLRLFTEVLPDDGVAVIHATRPELLPAMAAVKQRDVRLLTVGTRNAELVAEVMQADARGLQINLKYQGAPVALQLPMLGTFQAENLAAALGLLVAAGYPWAQLAAAAARVSGVPGRMELVPSGPTSPAVVVDYAHKPDALEKALQALRPLLKEEGRLVVAFGCGGDRDATKRPIMGRIAAELADEVFVTDDNPRTEDAATIRAQVLAGAHAVNGATVHDAGAREQALQAALNACGPHDILLVAGKGHEQGQIIGREVLPFDDRAEMRKLLGGV